jgi:hypothetical protein
VRVHATQPLRPSPAGRGEREGYGEPCDVTSLSLNAPSNAIAATEKHNYSPRVHVVPAAPVHNRHREVGRDLARREPR